MHVWIGRPTVMHSPSFARFTAQEFYCQPAVLFSLPARIETHRAKRRYDLLRLICQDTRDQQSGLHTACQPVRQVKQSLPIQIGEYQVERPPFMTFIQLAVLEDQLWTKTIQLRVFLRA